MRKNIVIAALIAVLAGAAQAQSSVTLYGVADGGIGYTQFKNRAGVKASMTGFWDGGYATNVWGLLGAEDLGGGLQAIFMLESGYSLANGERTYGGRMFGREAWVGLKSPAWGQLTFGRQTTAGYAWLADAAVPFGNNFTQAASTGAFSTSDFRYDNQIRYLSPEFGGWQAMVGYSFNADGNARFDANGTGQPNVRAWTSGVRYLNGPLTAVLTYDRITNARNTAYAALGEEGVAVSSWNAGFSYDFGVVKLHLGAGLTENGWFATPSQLMNAETGIGEIAIFNEGFRAYSYAVGAGIPAGAHGSVLAGWTMVDPSREGAAYAGTGLRPQHIFSLAYTYGLSPRTALYAIGTVGRNLSLTDGNRTRSLGAGLRHMF